MIYKSSNVVLIDHERLAKKIGNYSKKKKTFGFFGLRTTKRFDIFNRTQKKSNRFFFGKSKSDFLASTHFSPKTMMMTIHVLFILSSQGPINQSTLEKLATHKTDLLSIFSLLLLLLLLSLNLFPSSTSSLLIPS